MKRIVIIGAGPAGLTAAYELLKRGRDMEIIILEESHAIGGISRTINCGGNRMDIGGHRFFSKDTRVMRWWEEMMPLQGAPSYDDKILLRERKLKQGGPDPEKEDGVMLLRHRVSRIYYRKKFFDYPVNMKWQTIRNMGFLCTMKAGFSYLAACVHKREETSLENFYVNRFGKVLYSMFFEGYTEKLWGRHPSEISADWGAQRVKGLSIRAVLQDMLGKLLPGKKREVETSLIEEFWYPKYGPGQLWEITADKVKEAGGQIWMGAKVTSFKQEGGRITAVGFERDGREEWLEADEVLSSMPIKDLIEGMGEKVPEDMLRIAAGLPYRDFVTVGLLVKSLLLKNETRIKTLHDIVPDCWIYVQDTGVKLGRIQIFNNWSPYMVEKPEDTVYIGLEYFCREGDDFWNMSEEEARAFAIKELVHMGVLKGEEEVLACHRERVKKAYPAYFDTYLEMDKLIDYLNGFENLYCIGRNGQHRYNNMDHSMVTAFEAAENILTGRRDKTPIWKVNTEREYHEEGK